MGNSTTSNRTTCALECRLLCGEFRAVAAAVLLSVATAGECGHPLGLLGDWLSGDAAISAKRAGRDPAPELADRDLACLVWEDSADYALTHGLIDGRIELEAGELADLDAELEALLAEQRRPADLTTSVLGSWSDEAIVAEATRLERVARFAAGRGLELVHELARRRPDPCGAFDEAGLSAYALDEISGAAGITRYAACHRVAEADTFHTRFPRLLAATKTRADRELRPERRLGING